MKKVLVTPRSLTRVGHSALDLLTKEGFELVFSTPGKQPDEEELTSLLPGCIGYIAGAEKISAAVLEAATELKVISRYGTGVDSIDLQAAKNRNVEVLRAQGANARSVAELTIALLLGLTRSIPFSDAQMKSGNWERRKGFEIHHRNLGLIGCGKIGKIVAQMALDFGMTVWAYDAFPDPAFAPSDKFRFTSLEDVLSIGDVISFHCPPPEDGRPILDRGAMAMLKPGVYLINTARASLVDEDAVLEGLNTDRIAGLGIDVYDREPPGITPLLSHDRVIATPHIGAFTEESISRTAWAAVENLLEYLKDN